MSDAERTPTLRGTGFGTRLSFGVVVLLNATLAVAAAIALTWLATRPGLRERIDLTASGVNTLDQSTLRLLENLPEEARIEIDVFFRPLDQPLTQVGADVQGRMYHLLKLTEEERPGVVELTDHLRGVDATQNAQVAARMRELGIHDLNVIVVSNGPRREVLHLLGEIAEIDLGNPLRRQGQYVPPSVTAFRGEEALLKALLKVTQGEAQKVYFAWGHGERDLYGEDERSMGLLHSALLGDGFEPARWVPDEDGPVPADCAVLALIGPSDPLTPEEMDALRVYLDAGGRMIVAPGYELYRGQGSVAELLAEYGIDLGEGIVCVPVIDPATGRAYQGSQYCAGLILRGTEMAPQHPVTRPLVMGDRRVRLLLCNPLERGSRPPGGALLDLLASPQESWEDLPDAEGANDYTFDQERERAGPFAVAMTSVFSPRQQGPMPEVPGRTIERPESRLLAFGGADAFANGLFEFNRDLLLNSFNWAAGREYRVNVRTRDPDLRRLDVQRDRSLFAVHLFATIGLPGLCLALGLVTAWRRRR